MCKVEYTIDVRTISEANVKEHWATRDKRHQNQRIITHIATRNALLSLPKEHPLNQEEALINIKMMRVSTRKLDSDNLPTSMKAIQDSIANVLAPGLRPGQADGLPRFHWDYTQRKGKKGELRRLPDGTMETNVEITLSIYKTPTARDFKPTLLFKKRE